MDVTQRGSSDGMGGRIGHTAAVVMAIAAMAAAGESQAQIRIVDRTLIDSLANPQLAEGARAMRFGQTTVDTGTIGENDGPSVYEYRFRNEGAEPLAVTRVQTSCGCAVAEAVPKVVPAGGEGAIRVTYRPKGHPGRFMRRIFVYTQLSDTRPTAVLTLNADVAPAHDRSGEYSYRMGALLLRRRSVAFTAGESASESIEVCNAGERELTIDCRRHLLPAYVEFSCEPERIAPGERADITIRYDASRHTDGRTGREIPLMLTGTGISVLQSTVKVTIGE